MLFRSSGNSTVNMTLAGLRAQGLSTEQAMAQINRLIDQQAMTMSATDVFWISSLLFVAMTALIWFAKPAAPPAGGGAGGGAH